MIFRSVGKLPGRNKLQGQIFGRRRYSVSNRNNFSRDNFSPKAILKVLLTGIFVFHRNYLNLFMYNSYFIRILCIFSIMIGILSIVNLRWFIILYYIILLILIYYTYIVIYYYYVNFYM